MNTDHKLSGHIKRTWCDIFLNKTEGWGKLEQMNQLIQQTWLILRRIVLQAVVHVHTLTCGCVGTGDLSWKVLVCWLMERFLFFTQNHASTDTASPVSLLRALTGPRIPRVQLYYKAQDQEQERAAYFRKRVAPLLLHTHTHAHTCSVQNFNVVFIVVYVQHVCVGVLKVHTANQCLFFPWLGWNVHMTSL